MQNYNVTQQKKQYQIIGNYSTEKKHWKKVAVVGAGPAGLACAHALSREGVDVTIFEKKKREVD